MNRGKRIVTFLLITLIVVSGFTFIQNSTKYIGHNYFESKEFERNMERFTDDLSELVLNSLDIEQAKQKITVSKEEIEEHRNRYGTLSSQIENIRAQYEESIADAEQAGATEVKDARIKERDAKIADISKNFEDNEHVRKKIVQQKEQLLDQYGDDLQVRKQIFGSDFRYFAYDLTNIETGEVVSFGDTKADNIFKVTFGEDTPFIASPVRYSQLSRMSYVEEAKLEKIIPNKDLRFKGIITIPKAALKYSTFSREYERFDRNQTVFTILWIAGAVAIVLLLVVIRPRMEWFMEETKWKLIHNNWLIEVRIAILMICFYIFFCMLVSIDDSIQFFYYYDQPMLISIFSELTSLLLLLGLVVILVYQSIWLFEELKDDQKRVKLWQDSYTRLLFGKLQDLFLNRSLGIQSTFLLAIAFFAGVGLVGAFFTWELTFTYIFLLLFIGLPAMVLFLWRVSYLNRIMKEAEQIAKGRLHNEIQVKGKSVLAEHARNLNLLREGVRTSMSEQAKSERLKTELITNVSHDLRTPLTSIITYTDLLKNPHLTDEERDAYVAILDKKSQRLKTLIEDLFEVSKMASGNLELQKQRVDLVQLLQQAIAEHEEDLSSSSLDLRVAVPDEKVFSYVDGQKWWRVLDNLIVNTLKYSLEGTRVYIQLKEIDGEAVFTIKNVTKYELDENVEELFERFKRADTSRHTDGSGLGLAIAQSIVDLHGGRMSIDVDGDLFKVTVAVRTTR